MFTRVICKWKNFLYTLYIFQLFHNLSWGWGAENMLKLFGKWQMFPVMHWGSVVSELASNMRLKAQVTHSV